MPYSNDLLMSVARMIARMGTVELADATAYAGSVLRAWSSPAPLTQPYEKKNKLRRAKNLF